MATVKGVPPGHYLEMDVSGFWHPSVQVNERLSDFRPFPSGVVWEGSNWTGSELWGTLTSPGTATFRWEKAPSLLIINYGSLTNHTRFHIFEK